MEYLLLIITGHWQWALLLAFGVPAFIFIMVCITALFDKGEK